MKEFYLLNNNFLGDYGEIANSKLVEKKSIFISYIFKINNERDANSYIEKVRKENKDARHVVYIYSYLENNMCNIKFSDDGEPRGTGTKTIYELLTKEKITNVCIVIVRYFGGILLGAGPLSRTYLNSAKESIKLCHKETIHNFVNFSITINYSRYQIIKNIIDKKVEEGVVKNLDIKFSDNIDINLSIIDKHYDEIINIFNN